VSADVLVLCYHAVSDRWPSELAVTTEAIEAQVSLLLARGYRPATFGEVVLGRPARRALAVTFDDGYRSVYERAFPVLARLGVPATVFVVTDAVGDGRRLAWPGTDHWLATPYADELEPATPAQVRELAEAGWEIGSHTRSHPLLTTLDDAALADELAGSREASAALAGTPCLTIAYPYADVDDRVISAAAAAGYEAGAALPAHLHTAVALAWPRIGVFRGDGPLRFRAKVSTAGRRLRLLRLGVAIERAARATGRPGT
jgi:peptidoglycan/xylan/chitin deacetylase (PgdA/CDA1 family)